MIFHGGRIPSEGEREEWGRSVRVESQSMCARLPECRHYRGITRAKRCLTCRLYHRGGQVTGGTGEDDIGTHRPLFTKGITGVPHRIGRLPAFEALAYPRSDC